MSHLFVCFVALVIQGGAMAKFWPLIAPLQSMYERIGEKHLAQLVGEGACQPDIFTKINTGILWESVYINLIHIFTISNLGCDLSYDTLVLPISLRAL